jgi:hypothetical protein
MMASPIRGDKRLIVERHWNPDVRLRKSGATASTGLHIAWMACPAGPALFQLAPVTLELL